MPEITKRIKELSIGNRSKFVYNFYIGSLLLMSLPVFMSILRVLAGTSSYNNIYSIYWQSGTYLLVVVGSLMMYIRRRYFNVRSSRICLMLKDLLAIGYIGVGIFSSLINAHPTTGSAYIIMGLIALGINRTMRMQLVFSSITFALVYWVSLLNTVLDPYFYYMLLFGTYGVVLIISYTITELVNSFKLPLEETARALEDAAKVTQEIKEEMSSMITERKNTTK